MRDLLRSYIMRNSRQIEKLMAMAEIAALALCVAGIFMMMQRITVSSYLLITGISLLACIYGFHGNFLSEMFLLTKESLLVFAVKAGYLSLTIATLGILFRIQYWAGANILLLAGCVATGIFFLFFAYKAYISKPEDDRMPLIMNNLMVRMLPTLLIMFFLIALTART